MADNCGTKCTKSIIDSKISCFRKIYQLEYFYQIFVNTSFDGFYSIEIQMSKQKPKRWFLQNEMTFQYCHLLQIRNLYRQIFQMF